MRLRPIWSCALCFNNSLAVILIPFECRNVFMVTARTRALFDRFSDVSETLETEMWSRRDLNPRPLRCERSALPTELLPHPVARRDYSCEITDFR